MRSKSPLTPLTLCTFALILFGACAPSSAQTFNATLPALTITAPVYTITPTFTPSPTYTDTREPTITPSATDTATFTPPPTSTPSQTLTPSLVPTQSLYTLTPRSSAAAPPAYEAGDAPLSATTGWTCDDFPCENDIDGFLHRIQVPAGYRVEYVGQFPGQPLQITYGRDGRLYATVLENGTRSGAVYAMDADGTTTRYSGDFVSPLGLAFQPGTDVLYVSARMTPEQGAGIWRVPPGGGDPVPVISDLPCCLMMINNQANGMIFGQDGYLYLGVGSLSDTTENPPHSARAYADLVPYEASILRIQPLTGEVEVYAQGIRNPYDLASDSSGQLYATDNGLLSGLGDRVLQVDAGANYGWPYWRDRGCLNCPIKLASVTVSPDLLDFPPYTLPRGIVAYTGTQFPSNLFDNLFVDALERSRGRAARDPHRPAPPQRGQLRAGSLRHGLNPPD